MNTNKFLLGTLVGGVTFLILGFLIYMLALASFFEAHSVGPAGTAKEAPNMLFLVIGNFAYGGLLSYIFNKWAGIKTAATGAEAGAVIGLFVAMTWYFIQYAITNIMDLTGTIVDLIAYVIISSLVGAVIGWVLGRGAS
jgi:uncharacterized membrane protein